MMKHLLLLCIIAPLCLFLGSIYYYLSPLHEKTKKAIALITPTQGNKIHGVVTFTQEGNGVRIVADISDATPGSHGFHIHEFGNCACPDGNCTGSHYNPTNKQHGARTSAERHVGDFGNIEVNEQGIGHLDVVDSVISLNGPHAIIGRSVVVHGQADDLTSQPSGNAGSRIGCGVIGIAKID